MLSSQLAAWLAEVLTSVPPDHSIVAFNIGLFQAESGYCAYLSGASEFDANSNEWAVSPPYFPRAHYFSLPFGQSEDWQAVLAQIQNALVISLATPQLAGSAIARAHAVTTGFDDG
ncbi:MAG TPA: hypothetical protein VIE67_14310, partial [Rudaea sp.]|uniref:hypothetical protein n=1 Tax=Rudaea sp. TaxID=2136325 RepID=UPI002F9400AA